LEPHQCTVSEDSNIKADAYGERVEGPPDVSAALERARKAGRHEKRQVAPNVIGQWAAPLQRSGSCTGPVNAVDVATAFSLASASPTPGAI